MPAICVRVDDQTVATVCCDDSQVVDARIAGSLIEPDFATLEISTSKYSEVGSSDHQVWLKELPLRSGQTVTLTFLEVAAATGLRREIGEKDSDSTDANDDIHRPVEVLFDQLRAKPQYRSRYNFYANTPLHSAQRSSMEYGEFSFSFSVLWNCMRPNRVGVGLTTWTIDNLQYDTPGRTHFRENLDFGQGVSLRVDA